MQQTGTVDDAVVALGLEQHAAELDERGLTIIPPERAAPAGLVDRLLARVTELATDANGGVRPDFEHGTTHDDIASPGGQVLGRLLAEGPVFEEAMLNPVVQAMARHALGDDLALFTARSILKGPGVLPLFLHVDQRVNPIPRPLLCNATYLLSDYSRENGALCFVPGSHRLMRDPRGGENFSYGGLTFVDALARVEAGEPVTVTDAPEIVAVEAPKGSLVVWHGNTWHGAHNRTAPGLRVNLILVFADMFLRPQEPYPDCVPDEAFARHDERFARLLGRGIHLG